MLDHWLYRYGVAATCFVIGIFCFCNAWWQYRNRMILPFGGTREDAVPADEFSVGFWKLLTVMLVIGGISIWALAIWYPQA